ncbi:tRNA nucleotidyltransferase/poly(A) polymerase [Cellulophaga phage phi4:1]|uniref:tRNA nucleotidyltransferase/poly(A) polymerase n=3 Tax=Lightbulbvirus Cba41 TaxID=1918524 RepID=A0A0S2MWE1_9CAUD|nr:tRNA nucleotidyltransferase [Cellulophaga phage phi4:1]AGO49445.1 tRNA nucleotidyltransferase/poly(A) polymerase [Cellulophaga phage phi4:1]ALO80041.1 tRNA nucleotidyltransferase/poly(A) polymerase [Cellulophaga phage phi4:1_13]ALO80238.1 tRNA nucleotidyltransferase/poly(A) polymerase [Cellulophaga phage phi4:1_18]
MKYKLYIVGGAVRDGLLGLDTKDIDYSVLVEDRDKPILEVFEDFKAQLILEGFKIHLPTPSKLTIRAKFPEGHKFKGDADFVLARKELYYLENSRAPVSELGELYDDLVRRDFTVNAMAKDESGEIIDLFNGKRHLHYKVLHTPNDPMISFKEDPLRILRGIRFCVTKNFTFSKDCTAAIKELGINGLEVVSQDRIRTEMNKAFKADSAKTLKYLNFFEDELNYPIRSYIFDKTNLWLELTSKE